jgi:DNA-binding transcriptional LysR family regulator
MRLEPRATMDTELLKTFLAICRKRSFSKAAEQLHRTQPAISRRIGLLERELGVPLFERGAAELMLSQAGRVLEPFAERALAAVRDAEDAVRDLRQANAGPLSLAIVGTLAGRELSALLKRFAAKYPKVEIFLRTARSAEVSDFVRRGEATIGIRYDRDRSADLESSLLGTEPLLVVCGADHPLAGRRVRSFKTLGDQHWVAFPSPRDIAAEHVFGLFRAHGFGEVSFTPVDSLTAQKRLVEAGFGLALMPENNIAEELAGGTMRTIRVDDLSAGAPVYAVTRKGGYLSAAAQALREILVREYGAAFAGGGKTKRRPARRPR